jgi:hypothetical protein
LQEAALTEVLPAAFWAHATAVFGAELSFGRAVARTAALLARDVALADGTRLARDIVAAKADRCLGIAADTRRASVGTVGRLERFAGAALFNGAVTSDVRALALHAARAVGAARETVPTTSRATDGRAGERRRTGSQSALGFVGAGLTSRQAAVAFSLALARSCDPQGFERAFQYRLALPEAAAEIICQRIGIVSAHVVIGTVDGRASLVRGRRFGAAPGGAALLANAIAGGVTTNRRAVAARDAVTLAAIGVLGAGSTQPRLAGHNTLTQAIARPGGGLASGAFGLIERCALDAGATFAETCAVLFELRLVVAAALGTSGTRQLATGLVVGSRSTGPDGAGCRARGAELSASGVTTHAIDAKAGAAFQIARAGGAQDSADPPVELSVRGR